MRYFNRDPSQPSRQVGTLEERCLCGATYHAHYNGVCPCDECGKVHEGRNCPLDLGSVWNRSAFQLATLQSINAREDFDKFVLINGSIVESFNNPHPYLRPFDVLWYDKSGDLNYTRIGVRKVLKERSAVGHAT